MDIPMPEADVLIGPRDLEKFNIMWRIPNGTSLDMAIAALAHESKANHAIEAPKEDDTTTLISTSGKDVETAFESDAEIDPLQAQICTVRNEKRPQGEVEHPDRRHLSELLDFIPDAYGEEEEADSFDEAFQVPEYASQTPTGEIGIIPEDIQGTAELQRKLKKLLRKYNDLFQKEVLKTPAKIPPMRLIIRKNEWENTTKNVASYRPQSSKKQMEIARQLKVMLALGVIRDSKANRHSQVHLTPKPNEKWRFW